MPAVGDQHGAFAATLRSSPGAYLPMKGVAAPGGLPCAPSIRVRGRMNQRDRLDQLRGLRDRLERMPTSADRDWMLAQVGARAVDVETGAPAGPMRARREDESEPVASAAPRRTRRKPASPAQRARPVHVAPRIPAVPVRARAQHESVDLLAQGGVMCLDDPPDAGAGTSRPWSRGLRA